MKSATESVSCIAITGGPNTGKTTALIERIRQALALPNNGRVLVLSPSASALAVLRSALQEAVFETVGTFATSLLQEFTHADSRLERVRIVDDVEAELHFAASAEPLLALEWPEFAAETLDPEVPGLRSPARFLESAFRLIRKLRDAQISPETFLQAAQVGATEFYGKTPNLASADLLFYTKDSYRDSLDVTPSELQRQFQHETHLAKILSRLYRSYLDRQHEHGIFTERDAVAEATRLLNENPQQARELAARYSGVFVDEAQELNLGEIALLQALFGERLTGVTIAGDPNGSTGTFRGARPERVFSLCERPPREVSETKASSETNDVSAKKQGGTIAPELFRGPDQENEARFVAETVTERLRNGVSPSDIAIVFRSVHCVRVYEEVLLARNVPVQVIGDVNLFEDPRTLDALALLWNVHDPFRHEWMLRTLAAPAFALSDATLALLCSEPPDAQALLFQPDGEDAPTLRASRWDPRRDVRLGWNVLRGEQDAHLTPLARERVQHFRDLRAGWIEAQARLTLPDFARLVWRDGLARLGTPESARAHGQTLVLRRLLERMAQFAQTCRSARTLLGAFLHDAQQRADSALEACEDTGDNSSVRMITVDAVRGRHFKHVLIPNTRPGAFPRWYVPDAFLYSPSLGMIAKENVGDASTSRTAKFSYYVYRTKARERYNEEERRAFVYAMSRATETLTVSAWDRPTRGITAPELFEELKAKTNGEMRRKN